MKKKLCTPDETTRVIFTISTHKYRKLRKMARQEQKSLSLLINEWTDFHLWQAERPQEG